MRIRPARYLLRFDDLCPTMDRAGWERFEDLLSKFSIRPVLAIVPENQDPELVRESWDGTFWGHMRDWQTRGAAIALHGYRHLCVSDGRSLLPLHRFTEFAGVEEEVQRAWIEAGMKRLRDEGLEPKLFVAPRHGFDRATLRALKRAGMPAICDGFGAKPEVNRDILWIPQQLWEPVEKRSGVWTICVHSNTATKEQVQLLREFVSEHPAEFIGAEDAMALAEPVWCGMGAQTWGTAQFWRMRMKGWRRRRTQGS